MNRREDTEQKRVEKVLRERETLLNEFGEMTHVGGCELDVRTKAVRWTTETYRIHDISEDGKSGLSKAVFFFDLPGRSRLEAALQRCKGLLRSRGARAPHFLLPLTSE